MAPAAGYDRTPTNRTTPATRQEADIATQIQESIYSKYFLEERIGMRARSRLFEMCKIVKMPEVEDYRMRKT